MNLNDYPSLKQPHLYKIDTNPYESIDLIKKLIKEIELLKKEILELKQLVKNDK